MALGALAANFLLQDNGYVLINFRGYIIEMSVPIMAFLAILTYISVRFLVRLWRAPKQLGEAAARRRVRKAGERITQGYIEIGQGNFARGEKLLTKGARNSETPLLNYLQAARAAQAQGDIERRDAWLTMASEQEPRACDCRPKYMLAGKTGLHWNSHCRCCASWQKCLSLYWMTGPHKVGRCYCMKQQRMAHAPSSYGKPCPGLCEKCLSWWQRARIRWLLPALQNRQTRCCAMP
jgi:uncharacterized membrane-anchored protein